MKTGHSAAPVCYGALHAEATIGLEFFSRAQILREI